MAHAWPAAAPGGGNPWIAHGVLAPAFGMGPHHDDDDNGGGGNPADGAGAVALGAAQNVLAPVQPNPQALVDRDEGYESYGGRRKKQTRKSRRNKKSRRFRKNRRIKKTRRPRRRVRSRRRR